MFKLVPFILLLLLMTSRKGIYFDDDDDYFDVLEGIPTEYIKTNSFLRSPVIKSKIFGEAKGPHIVNLRKKLSKEVLDQIKKSEVTFLVQFDESEEEEWREFFVN